MLIFNGSKLLAGVIVAINLDGIKVTLLKDQLLNLLRNNPIIKLPV